MHWEELPTNTKSKEKMKKLGEKKIADDIIVQNANMFVTIVCYDISINLSEEKTNEKMDTIHPHGIDESIVSKIDWI